MWSEVQHGSPQLIQKLQTQSHHSSPCGSFVQIRKRRLLGEEENPCLPLANKALQVHGLVRRECFVQRHGNLAPGGEAQCQDTLSGAWARIEPSLPCQASTFVQHITCTTTAALSRKLHGSDPHQGLDQIWGNRGPFLILPTNLYFSQPYLSDLFVAPLFIPLNIPLGRTHSCGSTKLQRQLGHVVLLGDQEEKETWFLDHIHCLCHSPLICSSISYCVPHIESIDLNPSEISQRPSNDCNQLQGQDLGDVVQSSSSGQMQLPMICDL